MRLLKGQVLVPKETPAGPPAARIAWADELGQLLIVVGTDGAGAVSVNEPKEGRTFMRGVADVLAEYEVPEGEEVVPGRTGVRSWAATLERAAVEAARVNPGEYGGAATARYWQRVAAAVIKVYDEERQHG